jgi:hypothetical protein
MERKKMENGKKRKKRGDLYDKNMGPLPIVVFLTTPPWPFRSHSKVPKFHWGSNSQRKINKTKSLP